MLQLCRAVEQWEPRTETVALHAWLHPWLPYLGTRMDELYPGIRFKLSTALQQWHPSDQSALALLSPWHTVRILVSEAHSSSGLLSAYGGCLCQFAPWCYMAYSLSCFAALSSVFYCDRGHQLAYMHEKSYLVRNAIYTWDSKQHQHATWSCLSESAGNAVQQAKSSLHDFHNAITQQCKSCFCRCLMPRTGIRW